MDRNSYRIIINMNWIVYIVSLILICLKATTDGLVLSGNKDIASIVEIVYMSITILCTLAFITKQNISIIRYNPRFIQIVIGFILLRFALFDIVHNLWAGLDVFYIGNTKVYDILLRRFFEWSGIPSDHFLAMFKLISFLIGSSLIIKKVNAFR